MGEEINESLSSHVRQKPTLNHRGLHDGAFVSTVVGESEVLVEVANTAVVPVCSIPRSTTERAVRDTVSARVVTHSSPAAIAVGVGAVVLVAAVQGETGKAREWR